MKKKVYSIIIGILIVLAVFLYAHIGKTHNIYDKEVETGEYRTTTLYTNNDSLSQEFQCPEESLDGIRVRCNLTGDTNAVEVIYSLTDLSTNEEVASGTVGGDEFENNKFYQFSFDTVTGCKDKQYLFTIEILNQDAGNCINFSYQDGKEPGTSMSINEEDVNGTLIMRTVTDKFDMETFVVLLIFVIYVIAFMKFLNRLFK